MSTVVKFLLLGLGAGAMYGLIGQGLVVVYRASTIVNFAQGAMGMLGAYVYYELAPHTGSAPAVVVGVLVSAALGWITQMAIMTPMMSRGSSPLARIVATLGVLTVIEQALGIKYGDIGQSYIGFVPSHPWHLPGSIILGSDRIYLLCAGGVLSGALWLFYRFTKFGMATTASAENPTGAAALGCSPGRIMAFNWTLGGGLAGLAVILIGPLTGLSPEGGALLVVPALAAAMVGGFTSFPLTLAGGLLVGVLESESSNYFPTWTTAMPLLVITAILVGRGRALPVRGFLRDRLPRVGTGRMHPGAAAVCLALALGSIALFSTQWTNALIISAIAGVICLSLVLVTGYAGQVSLAQYAMAGIGALISGRLADAWGIPFLAALIIAVIGSAAAGVVVGFPALRVRGVNLAVITLGLGIVIESVVLGNPNWTGGPVRGTVIPPPHIGGWDIDAFSHPKSYAIVCIVAFALCGMMIANIRRGKTGRRLLAVRDNERAAASVGVSVFGAKLYAFAVASGVAGLGGVLLAFQNAHVNYSQFDIFSSITALTLSVIGGVGYVAGGGIAGVGASAGLTQEALNHLFRTTNYFLLALGCLLLLQLTVFPDGVAPRVIADLAALRRRFAGPGEQAAAPRETIRSVGGVRVQPQRLELVDISVAFGGVQAVKGVSLHVDAGEVVGLIGPNGAGKTTIIDAASGFNRPSGGRVLLSGRDIGSMPAHRRARAGLVRSWQSVELFEVLTVMENLLAASEDRKGLAYLMDMVRPGKPARSASLDAAVEQFGLNDILSRYPGELAYAQRHLVGIARAMCSGASILLLDEPAAGLDESSTGELIELLRKLSKEWGVGILLVEHDVPLVMRACDRIVVLDQGMIIAEGAPEDVRRNRRVVDAYFGAPVADEGHTGETAEVTVTAAASEATPPRRRDLATSAQPVIRAIDASAGYGHIAVLEGMNLEVRAGEVVALLGANGAGKTTTLRMLSGVIRHSSGAVELDGTPTEEPLHRRATRGVSYVTEERSIFGSLTAGQNLRLGRGTLLEAIGLVPQLEPLLRRRAGVLSGGEQQMLTLARALSGEPRLLLADELSLGLAPLIVRRLFEIVRAAADRGVGVLLVEQQARAVLPFCDHAYVLRRGRVVMELEGGELISSMEAIEQEYLWAGSGEGNVEQSVLIREG